MLNHNINYNSYPALTASFAVPKPLNKWKPISHSSRANRFTGQTLKSTRNKKYNGTLVQYRPTIAHLQMKRFNQLSKANRDWLTYYRKPQLLQQY
jgi:hypothetical protein